jgi:preprotein translocase subunit SecE
MAENTSKEASAAPKRRLNPIRFFSEVRREGSKVTWPSWKETWLTTIMVFIMVTLIMIFFTIVDSFLGFGVRYLLGLG